MKSLASSGYKCAYGKKSEEGKDDGVGVYWKPSEFELLQEVNVPFNYPALDCD